MAFLDIEMTELLNICTYLYGLKSSVDKNDFKNHNLQINIFLNLALCLEGPGCHVDKK